MGEKDAMGTQKSPKTNLIEVKKIKMVNNRILYRSIIRDTMNSVSQFSADSAVPLELISFSEPILIKEVEKTVFIP